ncbi:T9SS type A sorting domain-containing protein [Chryseobacterium zhengzhouense]|uniref:T9SS type A sorting domain-containing protein n=1 Tax=Chryseobacterium zhengzhouense TaxID=1636086 RepID=A0ABW2LZA8_9FLAO
MKKNLLTIGLLAIGLSVQAQVLLHVDDTAKMYVSNGTLVYNGGGLQTRGTGNIDLYGNMMVVGNNTSDVLRTITTNATDPKFDGGNIVLHLNSGAPVSATYGQLYITGIPQGNITGIVDKEYAATKHGSYQQIGIPFNGKSFSSLGTDLGNGTNAFNNTRWGGREILKWNNDKLRFDGSIPVTAPITSFTQAGITIDALSATSVTTPADRTAYYTVGTTNWVTDAVRMVKGSPYADGITGADRITLNSAPQLAVSFGVGTGNNQNFYYEKYNTYIFDNFSTTLAWTGDWGRYTYQFSNPYLTNIDLSLIGYDEGTSNTDNNDFGNNNIWGIAVDPQNVVYNSSTGTTSSYDLTQRVTFAANGVPNGNYNALVIKPLGTFKIKLRNGTNQLLDFDNLRRFSATPRAATTSYSVTAAKNTNNGTIKQLGVLALDANGNQIGETYYVVSPDYATGHIQNSAISSVQAVTTPSAIIQTFEEAPTGGIDQNYSSAYRLYINEANETNYLGKRIDMSVFGSNVASLKFEIRDNANLVADNTHILSGGTGFYYTVANGQAVQIKQGDVIPVANSNYGLYYGAPQNVLNTNEAKPQSRTLITYHPAIDNYIVRFDPEWKSASIEVFDASGKLVISEKSVKTNSDYVIKLDSNLKAVYVVKVVGNDGTIVNSKILIK